MRDKIGEGKCSQWSWQSIELVELLALVVFGLGRRF